jgi:Soluble lytic murein transglycosylase and related regulatory proteins (some contain LysM/invasin domains)
MTKDAKIYYAVAVLVLMSVLTAWLYTTFYTRYDSEAALEAERVGLEKRLILAVIRAESGFDESAKSEDGAVGLMQLLPKTAKWIYEEKLKLGEFDDDLLFQPAVNVRLGSWYLMYLIEKFGKDFGIIAYNAGEGVVVGWLSKGVTVETVPYPETAAYYKKVLKYYRLYRFK